MKLYTYYRSTAAYRVRIALHYKNIAYTPLPVNLLIGQQHEYAYAEINPQMRVPTLIDEDLTIGQSLAILEYLEEKYPEPALLPKTTEKRGFVRFIAQLIACDIHPLNNLGAVNYLKNTLHHDQKAVNAWYFHWLKKGFDALEALLSPQEGLFCIGDSVTLADVCLIPQIYNAHRFGFPMDAYPRLMDINHHCLSLSYFEQAKPEKQPDAPNPKKR